MTTKVDLRASNILQASSVGELVKRLTHWIGSVERIRAAKATNRKCEAEQTRLDKAIKDAREAIAAGEPQSLEAALRSIDLLSFELCEE